MTIMEKAFEDSKNKCCELIYTDDRFQSCDIYKQNIELFKTITFDTAHNRLHKSFNQNNTLTTFYKQLITKHDITTYSNYDDMIGYMMAYIIFLHDVVYKSIKDDREYNNLVDACFWNDEWTNITGTFQYIKMATVGIANIIITTIKHGVNPYNDKLKWLNVFQYNRHLPNIFNYIIAYVSFIINVLEAVLFDIMKGQFMNAIVGLVLIMTFSKHVAIRTYDNDTLLTTTNPSIYRRWAELYMTWNMCFIYYGEGVLREIPRGIATNLAENLLLYEDNDYSWWLYHRQTTLHARYYKVAKTNLFANNISWLNHDIAKKWQKYNYELAMDLFKDYCNMWKNYIFVHV